MASSADGAKHPRRRISRLPVPRHTAQFAKTEAEFFPGGHGGGKFIHPGGQTDGIGKFQAENFDGQSRRAKNASNDAAANGLAAGAAKALEGEIMRLFRILPEQNGRMP